MLNLYAIHHLFLNMVKASLSSRLLLFASVKFCIAIEIWKAYGESALSKIRRYEWYRAFKKGRQAVEKFPRSGQLCISTTNENFEKVRRLVVENRHMIRQEIAA